MIKLDIFTHHNLQPLNTLATPSVAGNYVRVKSAQEVKQALILSKELELPIMVLGGGSNIVLPDMYVGLVLHMAIEGIEVVDESVDYVWLKIGAGENWHNLVEHCLNFHYWGIENLALIPGTVGAAPIQNIGAYGVELDSVFEELTAIERHSLVDVTFQKDGCEFSYRDSVFRSRFKNQYVITHVTLRLNKKPKLNVEYPALQYALSENDQEALTPEKVANTVCQLRRSKLPDPNEIPNAGSFFKNPIISSNQINSIRESYPNLVSYPADGSNRKIAAAWLIDQAGWKGVEEFGVGMHRDQALVLVNPGRKSSTQVLAFAARVQNSVKEKFGIQLEMEPMRY